MSVRAAVYAKRYWVDVLLVAALSVLAVNRFAPDRVIGDVILYSVMSLQNVSLFFWEQNRLLNVGPALTSIIREPGLNLLANLVFPSLTFFLLLRVWSAQVLRLVGGVGNGFDARALFVLQACAWLVVLEDHAVYEVVIWHVEYPLSLLLLAFAWMVCFDWRAAGIVRYTCLTLLLALATGVNFSILLPAMAVVSTRMVVCRRIDADTVVFGFIAGCVFAAWWVVARLFPGPDTGVYGGFALQTLREGLPLVLGGLYHAMDVTKLAAILLGVLALMVVSRFSGSAPNGVRGMRPALAGAFAAFFSLGWILFFSGNAWVEVNQHHMRYFIVALFAVSVPVSIAVAGVSMPRPWLRHGAVVVSGLLLAAVLYRPFVALSDYEFVRQTSPFVDVADGAVYTGDYDYAWSAVMNATLRGEEAYGVAGRANGNGEALRSYAERVIDEKGVLPVICVRMGPDRCVDDANRYVGPLRLRERAFIPGEHAGWRLLLERGIPETRAVQVASGNHGWAFEGAELASQSGHVGWRSEHGVRTTGKSGALFYGPYRALDAGTYRLRMFGDVAAAEGAWIDVVARGGWVTYAKLPFKPGSDVVADLTFVIPRPERQVEVRVHVGKESRLSISGYELMRVGD
ncbi:hypothetical protein [Pseudazoarcus pumilus]|uniref:Glycosyltransferase RgtA/B/C/D-like domain-containing protein n=1 Tax=Pseudazoarcus pumilus TaxID=2067960 RepID=A0A2I6S8X7_9RHOO|nr:hypothetical protein [Pseudazoarcus pumilus]AUN95706.1 hypothetical protein C0099_12655 [Pseudazoarcus pumilus]